jgi:AcrR family transcriptional regulator
VAAVHDYDDQAEALLEGARRVLAAEGPGALTVRRICAEAGMSTMGVYSRFGGKDGVIEALFVDAFRGLAAAIAGSQDPPTDDHAERLLRGCRAYRRYALEHPGYYRIMFERFLPDWLPSAEAAEQSYEAFNMLATGLADGVAAGAFAADDPLLAAHTVWAVCHGLVSLELQAMGDADHAAAYELALRTVVDGLAAH